MSGEFPDFTFLAGDLRTGQIKVEVPLLAPQWEVVLNDSGSLSGGLTLGDPDVADLDPLVALAPARTFIAVEMDGALLYGGPIWAHKYSLRTRRLQLASSGLLSIFDHRKIISALQVLSANSPAADTVYQATTLQAVARKLIAQAGAHTGGYLPIVNVDGTPIASPYGTETGTAERTYRGYELTWVGDALRNLTGVEDGPDLLLAPRRKTDDPRFVEWVLRMGTPYLEQVGADWTLESTDIIDIECDVDGAGMASRAWVPGDGSQYDMKIGTADNMFLVEGAEYPLLEAEDAHKTTIEQATLDSHARALVDSRVRPVTNFVVTVRPEAQPGPASYSPGDWFTIPVWDDPYLPDGDYRCRLLSIGGSAEHLTLTMEPQAGVI